MKTNDFGWSRYQELLPEDLRVEKNNVARVAVHNKTNYLLYSDSGELQGIVRGKLLRFSENHELPKVGDWVRIAKSDHEAKAAIESVLPRATKISRKSAGENADEQVIAANVDILFIVQGLDDNYSPRRLERYVVMAREGGIKPVIVLNKADVAPNPQEALNETVKAFFGIDVFLVSAKENDGLDRLRSMIVPGITAAFVGSSGVGKSTIVNVLFGSEVQATQDVRLIDSKGKHTTTRREMVLLPNGGILIDTPGMRELAVWASEESVSGAFTDLEDLASQCMFGNCDHIKSQGCAVLAALQRDEITSERYEAFLKLRRESDFQASKDNKHILLERKRRDKKLHKGLRTILKTKRPRPERI